MTKGLFDLGKSPFLVSNDNSEKDKTRAFKTSQKNHIYDEQEGKCSMCGEKTPRSIMHFHHEKAYAKGGKTITSNAKGLCPNCHAKVHHKERVKEADKPNKERNTNPFSVNGSNPFMSDNRKSGGIFASTGSNNIFKTTNKNIFETSNKKKKQKNPWEF